MPSKFIIERAIETLHCAGKCELVWIGGVGSSKTVLVICLSKHRSRRCCLGLQSNVRRMNGDTVKEEWSWVLGRCPGGRVPLCMQRDRAWVPSTYKSGAAVQVCTCPPSARGTETDRDCLFLVTQPAQHSSEVQF